MSNYESPRIVELGTLADVTGANLTGDFTDFDFPSGTPQSELTFTN
ncbi:MAG TPA: lasso RiPP family leader peptide-containing protein [Acidimicrobiia bacterium]|nr:lasso RiPP family leader peptide-containing protein [Acidimicrobiia bacterium]